MYHRLLLLGLILLLPTVLAGCPGGDQAAEVELGGEVESGGSPPAAGVGGVIDAVQEDLDQANERLERIQEEIEAATNQ